MPNYPMTVRYTGPARSLHGLVGRARRVSANLLEVRFPFIPHEGQGATMHLPVGCFERVGVGIPARTRVRRSGFAERHDGTVIDGDVPEKVFVSWDYGVNPEAGRPAYLPLAQLELL